MRQRKRKKPLVDYSQSCVVTFDENLDIMQKRPWTRQLQRKSKKTNEGKGGEEIEENSRYGVYNGLNNSKNS
jgi:hypothetical protein